MAQTTEGREEWRPRNTSERTDPPGSVHLLHAQNSSY